jgi:hypothetical protein
MQYRVRLADLAVQDGRRALRGILRESENGNVDPGVLPLHGCLVDLLTRPVGLEPDPYPRRTFNDMRGRQYLLW